VVALRHLFHQNLPKTAQKMAQEHSIRTPRTARYFTLGEPSEKITTCWVVCHGYAQSGDEFIAQFSQLHNENTLIIAPEALSRFYKKMGNEVVASWMTRAQRVGEIEDYTTYLSAIHRKFIPKCAKNVEIILLGFSQGSTTLMRWLSVKKPRFHHAIIWGWTLPEDIDYAIMRSYLKNKQLWLVVGEKDQLLSQENWIKNIAFATAQALPFKEIRLEDTKHEVTSALIDRVKNEILQKTW
jgi:predicted esterase